jgi:ribosome maturation factor RimP
VFLDKPDGLNLDDIAAANAWVNEVIDKLEPFKGSYTLEVSSPGIDRPLRTLQHFAAHAGKQARVVLDGNQSARASQEEASGENPRTSSTKHNKTAAAARPRQNYTGTLLGVQYEPDVVLMEVDGLVVTLDFAAIKKAHLKGEVSFESRKEA